MAPRVIDLNGTGIQKQSIAGGAVTPGNLLIRNSAGAVIRHNAAAGRAGRLFAIENELQGEGIDDDYALNDTLQMMHFPPGGEVHALLPANAAAVVIGDFLESNGDGTLRKAEAIAASLTDSTTGTANDTLVDVTATPAQGLINDNFADLAAKVNALLPVGGHDGRIIGVALEAVDNSAGGSIVRIKIEVI